MSDASPRRARGALESEVMAALWAARRPLTPAEVQDALGAHVAYNTAQTVLIRLLAKGVLRRERAGRGHAYWPVQDAATSAAERMRAVLRERPDRRAVLQQFAASLDYADAEALRALLTQPGKHEGI